MDPIAFHIGPLAIRWYGICVAVGFLAGFGLVAGRASLHDLKREDTSDLTLGAMLGGILGARLLYIAQFWRQDFSGRVLEIFRVDHGGLVFYGGFIGATAVIAAMTYRKQMAPDDVADLIAPSVPLGHAIGRIGCFLNGCCYGREWDGIGAVCYCPALSCSAHMHEATQGHAPSLFPIQVVSAAVNVMICLILLGIWRLLPRRGQLLAAYVTIYAAARFLLEYGRGDHHDLIGPFTPSQMIALILFPTGIAAFMLLQKYGRPRRATS